MAALLFEQLDDVPDLLGAATIRYENGVRGIHDDQVFYPEQGYDFVAAIHVVAAGFLTQELRARGVAVGISRQKLIDRVPAADIVPAKIIAGHSNHVSALWRTP